MWIGTFARNSVLSVPRKRAILNSHCAECGKARRPKSTTAAFRTWPSTRSPRPSSTSVTSWDAEGAIRPAVTPSLTMLANYPSVVTVLSHSATSCNVPSLAVWPTIPLSGVTPNSTMPPRPLRKPQIVGSQSLINSQLGDAEASGRPDFVFHCDFEVQGR